MIDRHLVQNITVMRRALYQHNRACPMPAKSFRMHPLDFKRFEIRMIWGVPVEADEDVVRKRFRLECDGSAHGIEQALEDWA